MTLWIIAAAGAAVILFSALNIVRKPKLYRSPIGAFVVRMTAFVMFTLVVGYGTFMVGLLTDQLGLHLVGGIVMVSSYLMLGRIEREADRLGVFSMRG